MLLFSTVLSINDTMSKDDFIRLAIEWNQGSPHEENVIPGMVWNGERNIRYGDDSLWLAIEEYRNQNTIAIRYEKTETDGVVWDTDYVMNFNDMKMSVRLDRSYLDSALTVEYGFSTPHFISLLVEKGYIKDDGNLPVSNKPVIIDKDNLDILVDVINGVSHYHLPVVYISKTFFGEDPVNVKWIASRLKGVAHVLVQKDEWLNTRLRRECSGKNEYYGAVGIYYPNQAVGHKRLLYRAYEGSDDVLMERVIRSVIQYSNSQLVNTLYTWSGVNNALLRDRYSRQKEERVAAELEKAKALNDADELIEYFDADIKRLQQQVEQLTKANDALSYENQGLKAKLDSTEDVAIIYLGVEDEFFPGEIKEMILEAVAEKLKNTATKTRRYDVLADIIQRNGFEGVSEKRANTIKNLLRDYRTMSGTLRQALMSLGFTVTEDGKHYRLTYYGDGRYKTTVSKTASDHREGKNIASTIIKNMF